MHDLCYDPVSSPTRLVQRMGRTGRAKSGVVLLLLTDTERRQYEATASKFSVAIMSRRSQSACHGDV